MKKLLGLLAALAVLPAFAGTITTTGTLFAFGDCYIYHAAVPQWYRVSGSSLGTNNLVITAPDHFEISTDQNKNYRKVITLTPTGGNVAFTKIFIRFSPSSTGSKTGSISHASTGSTTQNLNVSGNAIAFTSLTTYYNTTGTNRGAALKTLLATKIGGHTSVGYNGLWTSYSSTDVFYDGKLWDVYSTRIDSTSPYTFTLSTNQCGTYGAEGDCYNREHTMPQSWFNQSAIPRSDLFHVLPTDGKVNGMRDNEPYGEVSAASATWTSLLGGKRGPNTTPGYTNTVFEPINEYKGDIARGFFYMATRYETDIDNWQVNGNANEVLDGTTFPCYDQWYIDLLVKWHNQDPPSSKEIKRNNTIHASIQYNRNPYIDSPQFVRRIWGGAIPNEPTAASTDLTFSNATNNSVTLNWTSGDGYRRIVVAKASSSVSGNPLDTFEYAANSTFGSGAVLSTGEYVVYNGMGSTVTVTGLSTGTNYYFKVFEYNGWTTSANYLTSSTLSSNTSTLPVKLLSFTATPDEGNNVFLKWQTASEENNDRFEIERSIDGISWIKTAEVKGAGNSNRKISYQVADDITALLANNPMQLLYRLKQTDFDGTFSYSNVVVVNLSGKLNNIDFSVTPNPFHQQLRISYQSPVSAQAHITLQNFTGIQLVNRYENIEKGNHEIDMDGIDHLPAGVYFLQIEQQNRTARFKLIKQ